VDFLGSGQQNKVYKVTLMNGIELAIKFSDNINVIKSSNFAYLYKNKFFCIMSIGHKATYSEAIKALKEIHKRGYVHGDVHPGNLIIRPQLRLESNKWVPIQNFETLIDGDLGGPFHSSKSLVNIRSNYPLIDEWTFKDDLVGLLNTKLSELNLLYNEGGIIKIKISIQLYNELLQKIIRVYNDDGDFDSIFQKISENKSTPLEFKSIICPIFWSDVEIPCDYCQLFNSCVNRIPICLLDVNESTFNYYDDLKHLNLQFYNFHGYILHNGHLERKCKNNSISSRNIQLLNNMTSSLNLVIRSENLELINNSLFIVVQIDPIFRRNL